MEQVWKIALVSLIFILLSIQNAIADNPFRHHQFADIQQKLT
ncbi:MAG: hypothetical protein V7K15_01420 [Nostoc sp.]